MELDVTDFFNNAAPIDYSASQAEIGENAGTDTWRAALDDSADYPLLDTEEKREEFREFVRRCGGWEWDEIAAWPDVELNALCMQFVAGDIREGDLTPGSDDAAWKEYGQRASNGQISGALFRDETDRRVYYTISN